MEVRFVLLQPLWHHFGKNLHINTTSSWVAITVAPTMNLFGFFRVSKKRDSHSLHYNDQDITNNLGDDDAMSNINGGTWNSALYRVPLPGTSSVVVVKKLQNRSGSPVDASLDNRCQSEVNLLGSIHHDNIISLADCLRTNNFIVLIYNHKENGSLHRWLHPDLPQLAAQGLVLDWPTRRNIAIGGVEGLCYLHHGRNHPIVHHNINSASILLDTSLNPKIAGFDFARINLAGPDQPVPISELTAANMFGYTAPEYVTMVTIKVDVYSIGVVLLELVTGRLPNEPVLDGHLATWAQNNCERLMEKTGDFSNVVDMVIPDRARYIKEMAAMFRLGVDCTVKKPEERPTIREVLFRLRNRCR